MMKMSSNRTLASLLSGLALLAIACGGEPPPASEESTMSQPVSDAPSNIVANNAFYYYANLDEANRFYTEVLGLETVADYGFAKILRVAGTSYLTLVDAESGMHTADEPKTVATALLTEELEGWYEYLKGEGVPMRNPEQGLVLEEGRPHHGFVAIDPEGYFLEFERFNPHPENARLMPILERAPSIKTGIGRRPAELGLIGTVTWMYYRDMPAIERFYEDVMGFEQVVDQGWAKVYQTSPTGFIGPVDETRGMHPFTEDKGVTVSFFTEDVDPWFDYLKTQAAFEFRTQEILNESDKVRVIVGYDPENYFLELDTFLDVEGNEQLVELLARP